MAKASRKLLERPLYSMSEAARLLALPPGTVRRWVDGYDRRGVSYPPVIRTERTGNDEVTWGEFVETGYLREYRRKKVSLQYIRPVVDGLRREYGTPYPLAHFRPFVSENRRLVLALQEDAHVPRQLHMVEYRSGQLLLAPEAEAFLDKIEFDGDLAHRMHPGGSASPVVIDPRRSFGVPTIRGIRTEILTELFLAGETIQDIASWHDLSEEEVQAAIRWEATLFRGAREAA